MDFEECRRHIDLIIEMCHDIRMSSTHDVRKVFQAASEKLDEDIQFIRKHEIRINRQNEQAINQLGDITKSKKALAKELRALIQKVKELDYRSKELQSNIHQVTNQISERMEDVGGQKQVSKIKQTLNSMKKEIKKSRFQEGMIVNSLFQFKNKMSNVMKDKNHLYDIDEDFTNA